MKNNKMTRRGFLQGTMIGAGSAISFPCLIPGSALGADEKIAPNSRINLACIGLGGQGTGNLMSFLNDERVQVVAICDVDANHRNSALQIAKLKKNAGYKDFRELLARKDVDAVMIATPDHWHSLVTVAACRAGKDIYCEKPLTASIGEGRFVSDLVRKEKRVLQCGTWRRSGIYTRMACELTRNGYIGELKEIEVGVPAKFQINGGYTGLEDPAPVPKELDYEMWLGPASEAPYTPARCHFNFRWILDYAPGYITDWGAHFIDVAQWGNNTDDSTPIAIKASGVQFRAKGIYNAPERFRIDYQYAKGVHMTMVSTADGARYGTKFIGTKGWIFTENTRLVTEPAELRRTKIKDSEVHLYLSKNHHRNFIDCVISRQETAAPVEAAHRAASCCHLGTIAASLGREVKFDPKSEVFPGDDEANKLLTRSMRGAWRLEA
jgi:predicted dehydrogenase